MIPLARSITARRANAPSRLVLGVAPERDVDRALHLARLAVDDVGEDPRFAARLTRTGSSASSSAITGHEASRTISEISSSACSLLTPRPTNARSGCSRSVAAATSVTSSSRAITSCPSSATTLAIRSSRSRRSFAIRIRSERLVSSVIAVSSNGRSRDAGSSILVHAFRPQRTRSERSRPQKPVGVPSVKHSIGGENGLPVVVPS